MSNDILTMHDVVIDGNGQLIGPLSFAIGTYAFAALIGPSHSGKSSIINAIAHIKPIKSGFLSVCGYTGKNKSQALKAQLGCIFEDSIFPYDLQVKDFRRLMGLIYDTWDANFYSSMLDTFSIDPSLQLASLDADAYLKFECALALSHHPKLLLIDESERLYSHSSRLELFTYIRTLLDNRSLAGALIASRSEMDLITYADQIIQLEKGSIVDSDEIDHCKTPVHASKSSKACEVSIS
ncbi:MAG: ATP-binding cassette domain-containing protein [Eggerthellaceae bacterium]|jgi:ABC-2 type transport system ATP-binding protein|nr:ATP-binding cassette domain-containing protein [Eggerthellaceae bacterium]MCH4220606.1 ATP-binding cassette domain-containing protein [Eggerthellaceae bacterium]